MRRIVSGTPTPIGIIPRRPPAISPPTMIWIVADTPIPIPPRIVRVSPPRTVVVIVGRRPTEIPISDPHSNVGRSPSTEHRRDVFGLDPHLIARHHYIVERRIVCRNIVICIAIAVIVVARGQSIGRRTETIQSTGIGTLVGVSQHARIVYSVVLILGSFGLRLGDTGLPLRTARLGLGTLQFGAFTLLVCYRYLIVYAIHSIAGIYRRVVCRRTSRHQHQCRNHRKNTL